MAHKRNFRYNKAQKPAKPFTGMMRQLDRETVVLCTMDKFADFKSALADADIDYDLGDFYNDGIIFIKK